MLSSTFVRAAAGDGNGSQIEQANIDPEIAAEYTSLAAKVSTKQLTKLKQEYMASSPALHCDPASNLLAVLQEEHNFSPAKARAYLRMLQKHAEKANQSRPDTSIVFYAVSDREPPGRPLAECNLVPVQLSYVHKEDEDLINPDSTSRLKWQRILRYTTEAKSQGAYLSQPDLAYLLGVHPEVIQKQMQNHAKVIVPTRGNLADMGPGISHMARIVELYMQGYTETQIKHRTGHSYESIEAYLKNFSTYVGLVEQGMPKNLIRKAMGKSMRVVNSCAHLYEKFNMPDYQWAFMKLRRIFQREEAAKKKGGDYITAKRFSMYEPLREKNLFNAQRAELIRRFDLNKESWLAEEVVYRVEEALTASEEEDSISRLYPGQLLTVCRGK